LKIAITGHTAGIGKSFATYLAARGHEIVGLSKREGNNICNIPKIVEQIIDCDMWINNAQSRYAQTELLYKIVDAWQGQRDKMIWIISTMMTQDLGVPDIPGQSWTAMAEYKNQKRALEDAFRQLKNRCKMCLIRPGAVATQSYNEPNVNAADTDAWVSAVCEFYITARSHNLWIEELSLGFKSQAPEL
jgi:nucleoside-diphosphate-sugar epimerase